MKKNLTASTGDERYYSSQRIHVTTFPRTYTDKELKAAYQKGLKDGEAIENVEVYSYNKGYQKGWRAGNKTKQKQIMERFIRWSNNHPTTYDEMWYVQSAIGDILGWPDWWGKIVKSVWEKDK